MLFFNEHTQINTTTDHSFGPPRRMPSELSTTSGQNYTAFHPKSEIFFLQRALILLNNKNKRVKFNEKNPFNMSYKKYQRLI